MKETYTIEATCSLCGYTEKYKMNEKETETFDKYFYGETQSYLQDLFPNVPAWIRSGAIDKKAGGFCICPNCCGI